MDLSAQMHLHPLAFGIYTLHFEILDMVVEVEVLCALTLGCVWSEQLGSCLQMAIYGVLGMVLSWRAKGVLEVMG